MAQVKYSAHIDEIRGSIQNVTYSRNRPGNFMRIRTTPRDPAVLKQVTLRNIHAAVVDAWRNTLTNPQRVVWNDLALITDFHSPTCRSYHPSGFSLFLRANVFRVTTDAAIAVVPDTTAQGPPTPFTIGGGAVAGHPYITADADWPDGKTGYLKFWHSPGVSQSTYYYRGPWAGWRDTTILIASNLPFKISDWDALADGQRVHLRIKAWYGTQGTIVTIPQHTYWDYNV